METDPPSDPVGETERPPLARVGLIVNPVAGGGRGLRNLPRIVSSLEDRATLAAVHLTQAPREAIDVAAAFAARGLRPIVAVGGDGTVNEVANGLASTSTTRAFLGVVPSGRGGDFARSVGIPRDLAGALNRLHVGTPRSIDVVRAEFDDGTSRIFVNVGGVGFDAEVAARAARSRLPGATAPYLVGVAGALRRFGTRQVTVEVNGERLVGPVLAVVVANGHSFGGGLRIVPDAQPDDGCLDVAIIGDVSRFDLLRQVPRVYRGTHVQHPQFTVVRATSVRVVADDPMPVQLDGEVVGSAPVTFVVAPAALQVMT